jgi:hypothetical protein
VAPAEIFKRAPEVMFRALVMHNSVIRTAKYANCGFVLEQEGDSFTLAFYNAFDAVAFCLQVSLKTAESCITCWQARVRTRAHGALTSA